MQQKAADPLVYMEPVIDILAKKWPDNRTVNIVCHGHSVPAGYFATPFVDTFVTYPHLLHTIIKQRFPFAVTNVIVTAIGGENSKSGQLRFASEVLNHKPDVVTIDYGLNDRPIGLQQAEKAWREMIEQALAYGVKVILLTPSWDQSYFKQDENWRALMGHTEQIRALSAEYQIGLADAFRCFQAEVKQPSDLVPLLSHVNHPSVVGHHLISQEIGTYFLAR